MASENNTTGVRGELYQHYVSRFKDAELGAPRTRSLLSYFSHKYARYFEGLDPDARLLEAGCGDGLFLSVLASKGYKNLEGVDISGEQVQLAQKRGLRVTHGDLLEYLEARPAEFHMIVALDVVEHFEKPEGLRLFELVFAALRPAGRLLLQTPNGEGLFSGRVVYGDLTHCTIFTPGSMRQALRHVGFEAIEFAETGPIPVGWKGCLRVAAWRALRVAANLARAAETGCVQTIWTENLLCSCRKPA